MVFLGPFPCYFNDFQCKAGIRSPASDESPQESNNLPPVEGLRVSGTANCLQLCPCHGGYHSSGKGIALGSFGKRMAAGLSPMVAEAVWIFPSFGMSVVCHFQDGLRWELCEWPESLPKAEGISVGAGPKLCTNQVQMSYFGGATGQDAACRNTHS